ncbi:unnamed protein product [Discula destructiva]
MHFNLLTALALPLLLGGPAIAAPAPAPELSKRCMTPEEITAFQASWSKSAGHGPAMIICNDGTTNGTPKTTPLPSS